jgi:uncharacterized NAD(P)/FAD-binding protein YdhS
MTFRPPRPLAVRWRPAGAGGLEHIDLRPGPDDGTIRADAAKLGIEVDNQAQTMNAEGEINRSLYALGPMTRGAFWEIVAVPDIRTQTWNLARRLSNAQWVGGEGL